MRDNLKWLLFNPSQVKKVRTPRRPKSKYFCRLSHFSIQTRGTEQLYLGCELGYREIRLYLSRQESVLLQAECVNQSRQSSNSATPGLSILQARGPSSCHAARNTFVFDLLQVLEQIQGCSLRNLALLQQSCSRTQGDNA